MADRIERPTCYLCSAEIPLQGKKRRVQEPGGKWHDEEEEPAPSFVSLPLYEKGELVRNAKGIPVSVFLCHKCGLEEAPPPEPGQQRLL